jgi:hypothetical protein
MMKYRLPIVGGVLLIALGCGSSTPEGDVAGVVTYRGQPVPGGVITFISDRGILSTAIIDPAGHYRVKAPVGAAKVTVNNLMLRKGQAAAGPRLKRPAGAGGAASVPAGTYKPIPEKYLSADQSGLAFTVQPGTQTFDVPL